jgi:protein-disulfide isomerase/uncharacterized membrane protein
MKKFAYAALGLSIFGAIISGILILEHYNPDNAISRLFCGSELINPCTALSQSKYAELFGIPVAAYGLLFYLSVLFIILIADYAAERYYAFSLAILLPLTLASILADIALGIFLIMMKLPCLLCIATYAVNLAMMGVLVWWYKTAKVQEKWTLPELYRELFFNIHVSSDRKAFYASFVLFIFLLPYAVFSTSGILKLRSDTTRPSKEQIQFELQNFYKQPVEKIEFPQNGMILGNPEAGVSLVVFTDFLCSYCYKFYLVEEYLLSKYGGQIKIIYFNYPLDKGCNPNLSKTIYKYSCTASRAILAASEAGILHRYIMKHFADYKNTDHEYDPGRAVEILESLNTVERKGMDGRKFLAAMNSGKTALLLEDHLRLAKKLGVDGTPTIFVGNRKIDGYRPIEVLDIIVKNELARKKLSQ